MKSEIKKGAIFGYINMFLTIIVGFVYTPILLRLIGQSEYGLYSLVVSVVAYLSVLDMGFGNAMVRYVAKSQAKKEKENEAQLNGLFLIMYLLIGIITLIIGIILFLNINSIFGASLTAAELSKAKIIMLILIGTIALSFPLSVFDSYALASERFVFLRVLNINKTIAIPVVMLPLLLMGYKSITLVIVTSVFTILYHVCTLIYDWKKLKISIKFGFSENEKKLVKEIMSYSFFIFLNIIIDLLYNNTDKFILGSVSGTIAVSVYAVAAKISEMNTTVSTTISGLFLPKITKTLEEKDGDKKVSDIFIKVSRIQLYIMALILTILIAFGKKFILLWAGKEYIDAYYIILLLIGPAIIPLTQNICISIIQAKNKHQFRSIVYIIIAVLNVALSIPLAKQYGGIGAAIGTALANLVGQIITMNIFYYKKINIDIPQYWKNFIRFIIPVIFLCAISFYINSQINITSWFVFFAEVFVYFVFYFIYCYIYMNDEEKSYIKKILRRF